MAADEVVETGRARRLASSLRRAAPLSSNPASSAALRERHLGIVERSHGGCRAPGRRRGPAGPRRAAPRAPSTAWLRAGWSPRAAATWSSSSATWRRRCSSVVVSSAARTRRTSPSSSRVAARRWATTSCSVRPGWRAAAAAASARASSAAPTTRSRSSTATAEATSRWPRGPRSPRASAGRGRARGPGRRRRPSGPPARLPRRGARHRAGRGGGGRPNRRPGQSSPTARAPASSAAIPAIRRSRTSSSRSRRSSRRPTAAVWSAIASAQLGLPPGVSAWAAATARRRTASASTVESDPTASAATRDVTLEAGQELAERRALGPRELVVALQGASSAARCSCSSTQAASGAARRGAAG